MKAWEICPTVHASHMYHSLPGSLVVTEWRRLRNEVLPAATLLALQLAAESAGEEGGTV